MSRWLALIVITISSVIPTSAQELEIPSVTIAGQGLRAPVTLAPADADAFRRRLNRPFRYEDSVPAAGGPSFTVTTAYWDEAIRRDSDEEHLRAADEAIYYPQGGYVRVQLGPRTAWLVTDLRQRAILDRYIRLAIAGAIGTSPSSLEVLAATAGSELVGAQIGDHVLNEQEKAGLWDSLRAVGAPSLLDPQAPPSSRNAAGVWLLFNLLEGRSLQYLYDGTTLTDALGTERYDATQIGDYIARFASARPLEIQHEEPAGSLLWWPVMIGGGLAAIAAAVWLRRRTIATPPDAA